MFINYPSFIEMMILALSKIMLFLFPGDVTVLLRQIMAEARHLTQVRTNFMGVVEIVFLCFGEEMKKEIFFLQTLKFFSKVYCLANWIYLFLFSFHSSSLV